MTPLIYADEGQELEIRKISGSQAVRQHLADLGFVVGDMIAVVSKIGGNLIVKVKESRVAISREMAEKIYV